MYQVPEQCCKMSKFTHLDAFLLLCSIFTYIVDVALDVILAVTYFSDGYYAYGTVTAILSFVPTVAVQVSSYCSRRALTPAWKRLKLSKETIQFDLLYLTEMTISAKYGSLKYMGSGPLGAAQPYITRMVTLYMKID